jgi:predicted nucleic acid-binding protein
VNTYFETSAIVKLVVVEEGSDEAGALWDGSDLVFTSRLAYVEARAALAAARRGRRLSPKGLERGKQALEGRFEEVDLIEVTAEIARTASDLAEEHGLRGYDAVHLASAFALGAGSVVLVTWDRELAHAAGTVGFHLGGVRVD